jgi:cytochrome b subunit of formate dehydrogenase
MIAILAALSSVKTLPKLPRGLLRGARCLLLLAALAGPTRLLAEDLKNSDCFLCHEDKTLASTNAVGKVKVLFVDAAKLAGSVHKSNLCVNCHADITAKHPDDNVPAKLPTCTGCHTVPPNHEQSSAQYAASIHGSSHTQGSLAAATCGDCHGSHDMIPVKDPASPVFKLNLPGTCGKCHKDDTFTSKNRVNNPHAAAQYIDSMHGKALLKLGLIVAPSCNDCHGVHDIKRSSIPASPVNPANVAKTCGKCHVGIEQTYDKSIHGQLRAKGDSRAPVCTTCHTAHEIESPTGNHFKSGSDQRCGQCHADRLEHYRETYHGKAMALGRPNRAADVAACYDCHGYHDVLPAANPQSHLSKANIVATCAKCHPGATPSFAQYVPHANQMDKANYPQFYWVFVFMTALLIGTFSFFGAHTLFWLFRSAWLYLHDSKTYREAKIGTQQGDEWFTRFTPFQRFLHVLVVTSFLLLVITGMPLKFYYTDWAKWLFNAMGGTDVARSLHHFGALITFLYFGLHLSALVNRTWQRRADFQDPTTRRYSFKRITDYWLGPDSMVPTFQDWRDFIAHQKWFFGHGPKPQFERWTYWEKFDYFAVFWGVAIIGFSGLIMWFPLFFSKFMPGWAINIALIVHSDEALLAAGFIFTVHFFNTHFRLEKFPMDTVIFSGRVSKSEMLHERKTWYNRLLKTGRIEQHRIRDEWERWKGIARAFGYAFFGTGVILLGLIIYAMVKRLLHGG